MINDEVRSHIDQEMAMVCEVWPTYLRNYFVALIKAGFTHDEAMSLMINFHMYRLMKVHD